MSRNYSYSDWVMAHVMQRRYACAHKDLVTFYTAKLRALSHLFGIPDYWPESRGFGMESSPLLDLFRSTVSSYLEVTSPFDRYYEAPTEVVEMYRRFGEQVGESRAAYRRILLELLEQIFLEVHGEKKGELSFSSADLRSVGFDDVNAPDPYDYW